MLSSASANSKRMQQVVSALAGAPIEPPVRIGGGSNNQVYRVSANGSDFALKLYLEDASDSRDRIGAEYSALCFLSGNGVSSVPAPVAIDREHNLALYEWVEGEPVTTPTDDDISTALEFVGVLHELRKSADAMKLPLASQTCLSAGELVLQIERRLDDLMCVAPPNSRLDHLTKQCIRPCFEEAEMLARRHYDCSGMDFDANLSREFCTLSPADFGFHNARRKSDGRLMFFDFEYFGWDEPVKLGTEFLLHPGMSLSAEQKRRFIAETESIYGDDPDYAARARTLFPLYGLRWSLIVLNEFLPIRWERRVIAGNEAEREVVLDNQLRKSNDLLEVAERSLRSFPYDS